MKFVEDKPSGYFWSIVIYSHLQQKAFKKCGYQGCPVCQSVCLSIRGLPNELLRNIIRTFCTTKCLQFTLLIKSDNNYGHFTLGPTCISACISRGTNVTRSHNNFCSRNETIHFVFFYTIFHQLDDFHKIFIEHKMF